MLLKEYIYIEMVYDLHADVLLR